jgi:hypothetical protein
MWEFCWQKTPPNGGTNSYCQSGTTEAAVEIFVQREGRMQKKTSWFPGCFSD